MANKQKNLVKPIAFVVVWSIAMLSAVLCLANLDWYEKAEKVTGPYTIVLKGEAVEIPPNSGVTVKVLETGIRVKNTSTSFGSKTSTKVVGEPYAVLEITSSHVEVEVGKGK